MRMEGPELPIAGANEPDHELVDVVRDIIAGKEPCNPKVRKLE